MQAVAKKTFRRQSQELAADHADRETGSKLDWMAVRVDLLDLLDLLAFPQQASLPSSLRRFRARLRVHQVVPPPEAAGVIADEAFVMGIVVSRAGPKGEEVMEAPGKVVAAVRVDGLEEPEDDEDVHREDVKVARQGGPENRSAQRTDAEDQRFDGRRVLGCETERGGVLVMQLMDALVERSPVQQPMRPIMPSILQHEEDGDLIRHRPDRRKRDACLEPKVQRQRVKQPGCRQPLSTLAT